MKNKELTMTLGKVIDIHRTLKERVRSANFPIKLSYAIARNIGFLEPEIKAVEAAGEPSPQFKEYEKARMELLKKYAQKGPGGVIKTDGRGNALLEDDAQKEFDKQLEILVDSYGSAIKEQEAKNEEVQNLVRSEVAVNCYQINWNWLPKSGIDQEVMNAIVEMIDESTIPDDDLPVESVDNNQKDLTA